MSVRRVAGRAVGTAGLGAVLMTALQSSTGPALAQVIGSAVAAVLALGAVLVAAVVSTVLALILTSGLSCYETRRRHAAETVGLLAYLWHRRDRPDLDLTPATATLRTRHKNGRVPV